MARGTQLSVALENKPGELARMASVVARAKANIEAMAVADDGRGLGLQWAGGGPFSHLVPSEAARIVSELCAYIRELERSLEDARDACPQEWGVGE